MSDPTSLFGSDSGYSDLGSDIKPETTSEPSLAESPSSSPFTFVDQTSSFPAPDTSSSANNETESPLLDDDEDLVNLPSTVADSGLLSDNLSSNSVSALTVVRKTPSLRDLLTSCAINCILPFINGMMLGFGEIFAHELGFRWGWSAARVSYFF